MRADEKLPNSISLVASPAFLDQAKVLLPFFLNFTLD